MECGVLATGLLSRPLLALQQDNEMAARMALAGPFLLVSLVLSLAFYIYLAICLQTIAKKTNTSNGWLAWIPIANIILMLNVAKKPIWWIILCLIPIVNLVMVIIIWMAIARARNKPDWWGILTIVPIVNIIVPGYLAFSGDGVVISPVSTPPSGEMAATRQGPEGYRGGGTEPNLGGGACSLYCVSGEFAHDSVEIPEAGLYIGRDPSKANLVLSSKEVSSVHAHVRPEPGGSQVCVEDWNSLNGTFYQPDAQGSPQEWKQIKGKVLLSRGAHFRLGDNIAEFEIKAS
jgi:hypothetical protein